MTTIKQPKHKLKLLTLLLLFTSALTFTLFSCSSPTNPDLLPSLTITVDGVTSTEAFIKLSTNNVSLPASVVLSRNNKQINNFTLITADTTIVDNNLNPNQSYTYSAELTGANNQKAVSGSVQIQTMDTTSHNFTWQTFTFGGQGGSSTLYDVAIINENDIWAVGEMYVYDSTGTPILYNAVHWNGSKWELKRILYKGVIWTIRTIYAFNSNDIWFSAFVRYNGKKFISLPIPDILIGWSVNKLWGSSSNNLYAVGNGGNIAHYNGGSWRKIESGVDVDLKDVWGTPDGNIVWFCGKEDFKPTVLLKYSNNTIEKIIEDTENLFIYSDSIISGGINSIWTNDSKKIFVLTWFDLYRASTETKGNAQTLWGGNPATWGVERMRANNVNDIIAGGVFSRIWHFNGVGWKRYEGLIDQKDVLYGIDIKGNTAVSVGNRYYNGVENFGLIHLGKR